MRLVRFCSLAKDCLRYTGLWLALSISLLSPSTYACYKTYTVLEKQPYDARIFTQGLFLSDEYFYISSGGYGKSFVSILDLDGKPVKQRALAPQLFAEGLTRIGDELFILTWRAGKLIKLHARTLEHLGEISYTGQGWGLTHTEEFFVVSDGSSVLSFRGLDDFEQIRTLPVTDSARTVDRINELEYAKGALWANLWLTDDIVAIAPDTGKVSHRWNLQALRQELGINEHNSVLNGIAYDADRDAFWITGKRWPTRFLIRFDTACTAR